MNFKVFTDSYTSRVTHSQCENFFHINSQTEEESMFKSLTSQWKILKKDSIDFTQVEPFFGNHSLLSDSEEQALKRQFPIDETLIDYAIQFEFQNPMYNMFSNQVKHLIAHFTLSGMVRKSKMTQLEMFQNTFQQIKSKNENAFVSDIPKFATSDREINRFHWKSLVKDFIYGHSVFQNDEDSRRFLQLLQQERAFQERVMQVFELSDPKTDVDFVTFYLKSLYFDLKAQRP